MERFAFGQNWQSFAKRLTFEDFLSAKNSLQQLVGDLTGKTFLDVGCGSGLFSIAAAALGARKVLAFDVDPQCVETSGQLLEQICPWDKSINKEAITFKNASILDATLDVGRWDVVYSWGVLHHTGNMYKAFDAIVNYVVDNGTLAIAIYNKHFTSPIWKMVKYTYVKSPAFIRKLLVVLVLIVKLPAVFLISRQNPFKKDRGMSYYTDIVDWVGGYPYEYASPDEVTRFFEQRGFKLKKLIKTKGFTGCNEFVFERVS